MKNYHQNITVLCAVLTSIFVLAVTDAYAECPPPPATSPLAAGEIGLFFDPTGTMTCDNVPIGMLVPLYLVVRVPAGGLAEYAIPELIAPTGPFVIIGGGGLPDSLYELLIVIDGCSIARRIDQQSCPVAEGDIRVLTVYQIMFFGSSGSYCFQTACPTIAGTVAMNPGYNRCDTGAAGVLTGGESMCIGLNQAPVPVETSSWGRIKALYTGD